jgi:hypothetical protein
LDFERKRTVIVRWWWSAEPELYGLWYVLVFENVNPSVLFF